MENLAHLAPVIYTAPSPLAYSLPAAAEAVGVSLSTVRTEIKSGALRVRYVGTKPIIPTDELSAWLKRLPLRAPTR